MNILIQVAISFGVLAALIGAAGLTINYYLVPRLHKNEFYNEKDEEFQEFKLSACDMVNQFNKDQSIKVIYNTSSSVCLFTSVAFIVITMICVIGFYVVPSFRKAS